MGNPEVLDVHHIHIWPISTTENALTAHVKVADMLKEEVIKKNIKKSLAELGISHATLEFEGPDSECCDEIIAED